MRLAAVWIGMLIVAATASLSDTTNGYSPDLDTGVRFVFTHEAG